MDSERTIVLNVNDAMNAGTDMLKRHTFEHDRSEKLRMNDIVNNSDNDSEPNMWYASIWQKNQYWL